MIDSKIKYYLFNLLILNVGSLQLLFFDFEFKNICLQKHIVILYIKIVYKLW